jgi:LysM repeat protein
MRILRHTLVGLAATLVLVCSTHRGAHATEHTVYEGQSLWTIAKRYNVSAEAIAKANHLDEDAPLRAGVTLVIPDGKGVTKKSASSRPAAKRSSSAYVVSEGDSLWSIAERHGISVAELCEANGMREGAPLRPGQELVVPGAAAPQGRTAAEAKKPTISVLRAPDPSTQFEKSPEERGGVNPCMTADPGYGTYDRWSGANLRTGVALVPQAGGITRSGRFDVMFHFHGHEPVRKEWVRVMDGAVLVGVTLGIGSGVYSSSFSNPHLFQQLIADVEKMVAKKAGRESAKVRKIGLSAWSAGYGAIEQILTQRAGARVDSVILLDGLHSGTDAQLQPFVNFARQAKAGRKFMFVSHSSIIPPGYASTTEVVNRLVSKLGSTPRKARPRASDPMGLELIARLDLGNFVVRGFRGNGKLDHCAHIGLYRDVLRAYIARRWNSPRGRKAS